MSTGLFGQILKPRALAETDDLGAHIRAENVELDVDFAGNNCAEISLLNVLGIGFGPRSDFLDRYLTDDFSRNHQRVTSVNESKIFKWAGIEYSHYPHVVLQLKLSIKTPFLLKQDR
uniref:(northern house mosquito) hypothetical protein n=1 Tax=Culex pipiens TaxID=7175 RepID=A0A8D7ZYT9_CULPI